MSATYDVAVVGLGAMGSAAAAHLSRRGLKVVGFDQHHPPHDLGSSHGDSRIIRSAYWEGDYVPLVRRAFELWRELEAASGRSLLVPAGALLLLSRESPDLRRCEESARLHDVPNEVLTRDEVHDRFPMFSPAPDHVGFWDPTAAILRPEACIEAQLALARRTGATLRTGERVLSWRARRDRVEVETTRGTTAADHLVLAAGAWITSLVPGLPLTVERQVVHWFERGPRAEALGPGTLPIFLVELAYKRSFYGTPDLGRGVKIALHHGGETTTADDVRRTVTHDEVLETRAMASRFLPALDGPVRESSVCLYTNAPDDHFVIDRHPAHPNVVIASPCSGHGFKFAPAVGEIVADLVTGERSGLDLRLFRVGRFGH